MKPIRKNFILITTTLVLLGYLDLTLYYNHFGISIHPYLSISEIIFSFTDILLYVLVICTVLPLFSYISWLNLIPNWMKVPTKFYNSYIVTSLGLILGISMILFDSLTGRAPVGLIYFIILLISLLVINRPIRSESPDLSMEPKKDFFSVLLGSKTLPRPIHRYIFSIFLVLNFFLVYNQSKAELITIHNKPRFLVEFELDGVSYKSTDTFRHIGSTNNYLFFYDANSSSSHVFSLKEIKAHKVRRNKN